ncbi:hypothetical protein MA16_Dca013892 [Dendrobium catenatum]|uniref:Uncharacterized protein n=1 Tax=Dendrobium catenatum TaxID=906689 RepID=A0A2I0WCP3_9ASPA|nr:hypothetical protein MA16_Dca013892 [Dendrobium catenatum]
MVASNLLHLAPPVALEEFEGGSPRERLVYIRDLEIESLQEFNALDLPNLLKGVLRLCLLLGLVTILFYAIRSFGLYFFPVRMGLGSGLRCSEILAVWLLFFCPTLVGGDLLVLFGLSSYSLVGIFSVMALGLFLIFASLGIHVVSYFFFEYGQQHYPFLYWTCLE